MKTSGWIFMIIGWSLIIGITIWSFKKSLSK